MKDNFKNLGFGTTLNLYTSMANNMKAISSINNIVDLSGLSSVFRQQELFQKSVGLNSSIGLSAIQNMQNALNPIRKQASLFQPLSIQLSEIVKQQETVSKSMAGLASLSLPNNLFRSIEIIKKQSIPNFSKALSGLALIQQQQIQLGEILPKYLTNSLDFYIRQRINTDEFEVDDIVNDMEEVSSKLHEISESKNITKDDVAFIKNTLKKNDTSGFIYFIIQVVLAFLLSSDLYKSQQPCINFIINKQEKKEIVKGFSETLNILSLEIRKAKTKVNLRSKPSSKSVKISVVNEGQFVFVQEINHKWIRVVYQDDEYMIQSGWVYKKYFEKIN